MSDVTVVQTPKGHTTIHYKGKMLATISGAGITREDRLKYAKIMAESIESHDTKEARSDNARPTTFDGIISEMRDALIAIKTINDKRLHDGLGYEINDILEKALAIPRRNCDVGTPEEQTERYRKFCFAHRYLGSDFSYTCKGFGKGRCPFFNSHTKSKCEFAWAQTPYEEERKGKTDA